MDELTESELDAMLERAQREEAEWGWYRDDVPRLVAEIRRDRPDPLPSAGRVLLWAGYRAVAREQGIELTDDQCEYWERHKINVLQLPGLLPPAGHEHQDAPDHG